MLIPTWNAGALLDRVFERLAMQRGSEGFEICVVDSGSSDDTLDRLRRWQRELPCALSIAQVSQAEFDHGETRNQLASMSRGEFLVYLSQDAIPADADFLSKLLRNFDDPQVGAAYARQSHRPEASAELRALTRDDPARSSERREVRLPSPEVHARMNPHERRLLCDMSNVASAVRRNLWERHPFPRTVFGEDVLMARGLLEAGFTLVYDPQACVEHTHDDTAETLFERGRLDGAFNARWFGRICVEREGDVDVLVERAESGDDPALASRLRERRRALFLGLHHGGREALRGVGCEGGCEGRATRMLDPRPLRILYVVHGFPPEASAGTEIYTHDLAQAMRSRGHEVAVFTRSPNPDGRARDFEVERGRWNGLEVHRMRHALDHDRLRESYREPRAERAFVGVVERFAPDVVHFQHLIHLSTGLVDTAERAGAATVAHAHDYWAVCPRVQMIRPDGERCASSMGLGCQVCVGDGNHAAIPRYAKATRHLAPFVDSAASLFASLARGSRAAGRVQAYLDLRARENVVPKAFAQCDLIVSPSRFLKDRLLDTGAFDASRVAVSRNGICHPGKMDEKKQPDPRGRLRVGFVGSLVWYKGADVLLRAAARMPEAALAVSLFGDFQPEHDAHHALLRDLAGNNVRFHGRFERERLGEVFSQFDVLVVPSLWFENSPTVIQEAFLARTPVLTSDIGGMAEAVRDEVDGLHFAAGDDASLASVLARLVSDRGLLEAMAKNLPQARSIEDDAALHESRYRSLCTFNEVRSGDRVAGMTLEPEPPEVA
ncbi:MAG: glycosyltransferase [Myxococcota bacterium]|nr:glycosyltransferase [Myxococcota bacterium]